MVDLAPGERFTMRTEWFPTRMGRAFKTATYAVRRRPTADGDGHRAESQQRQIQLDRIPLSRTRRRPPRRGVSRSRESSVCSSPAASSRRFYDREGLALGAAPSSSEPAAARRSPDHRIRARGDGACPHLVDPNGLDRGPLGEAAVALVRATGAK